MEERFAAHFLDMSEIGYGLSLRTVMRMAFKIAKASQCKHPFGNETAGWAWMDGFRRLNPRPLSYYQAMCDKPMHIYNCPYST